MSYSRFGDSFWYTYWKAQADETENINTAIFEICGVVSFTSEQLKDNLESCLKVVKKIEPHGDIDELKIYINEFLNDVNEEYVSKN